MERPLAPVQPVHRPKGSARARQAHTLLCVFPLTVMMLGTLLVLFALIMTLSADVDGAVRQGTSISSLARSRAKPREDAPLLKLMSGARWLSR
jgi:hypothetical protein